MIKISVTTDRVVGLAEGLERAARTTALRQVAVQAVNAVATRFDRDAQRGATAGINLMPAYVRSKTDLALAPAAGSGPARAEVLTRGDLTIMGRYPIKQLFKRAGPARQNKKRGTYKGGPSKGDPKRGIPAGMKQAGLSVMIKKGYPAQSGAWFTMTLRRGREPGDDVGVFFRPKGGKAQHRYALAPYSLQRFQIRTRAEQVEQALYDEGMSRMRQVLDAMAAGKVNRGSFFGA